jgi:Ca-activated chloride channel family protein
MTYGSPDYSYYFFGIAALILFFVWSTRRRRALMERFVDKGLLEQMTQDLSRRRRVLKQAFLVAAASLSIFAIMRPQWGFQWEEVKRSGLDILIAMDTSRSMLARDVKPNRLERAKLAVKDMVMKLKGDRIGLIAFSGTSFLQCPLTIDYDGFMLALDDLAATTIPRGGTSISAAVREAMDVFKGPEKKYKVLIVITDGEDHEGDPVRMAKEADKEGVKIFCIGVGSKEGDIIPVVTDEGLRDYLKDREGNVVKSKLNEAVLQEIALTTGGAYIHATGADFGLSQMYDQKISKLEKRDIESKMRKRYQERFQVFLAAAIALLFIEPLIGERRMVK